jgi:hypothetical protein
MKKRTLLLLTGMTAAVLVLTAGVALAADPIFCSTNPCMGTDQDDDIRGTDNPETIDALGGNDEAFGAGGDDKVYGREGDDPRLAGDAQGNEALDGSDEVYGGPGADSLYADGYSDLLSGGGGPDDIDARENASAGTHVPGTDTVKGGGGNDSIYAIDGAVDHIDCGKGKRDEVFRDKGMDTIQNCEVRRTS